MKMINISCWVTILMNESAPSRDSHGNLKCPRCNSPLIEKSAPFYLHSEYVGKFNSKVCEICNFSALTSQGYEDSIRVARQMGLVGPAQEIIMETIRSSEEIEPIEVIFDYSSPVVSISVTKHLNLTQDKIKMETVQKMDSFRNHQQYKKEYVSKRTEIVAKHRAH